MLYYCAWTSPLSHRTIIVYHSLYHLVSRQSLIVNLCNLNGVYNLESNSELTKQT
jgi:hypothetical protein